MNQNIDDYKAECGYKCYVCGYATKYKNDFRRHLTKKNPCITDTININLMKANNNTINVDNSFNYIINNNTKQNDELVEKLKIELEKNKTENEFLKMENNKLKIENDLLKNEITELKNERKELFNMLKINQTSPPPPPVQVSPPPLPVQPQPAPQIIQIVQPTPEPPKPKEVIKKDKPSHYRELYKDCIVLNDFINNLDYSPEDLHSIYRASGGDREHKYINGISKLFIKFINQIKTETDRPIFCSDKSLNTIHFKFRDTEPKYKMVAYSWEQINEKYKDKIKNDELDIDELEQNEWGEYLVKEIDTDYKAEPVWIKESQDYPIFTKILFNFHKKLIQFCSTKDFEKCQYAEYLMNINDDLTNQHTSLHRIKEIIVETVCIMTEISIKDDIKKFVSAICKGIYVE